VAHAAVQGVSAVSQILDALALLDADPQVDVIVLARGGGSAEDLLPFSDEALCRAVARCRTPVVAAIGHEPDHPIVDDVADVRCSTPTDAGKRVVPDAAAELRAVDGLRTRARRALAGWVRTEHAHLARLTGATVLADPHAPLNYRIEEIARLVLRSRGRIVTTMDGIDRDLAHRRAQLAALGPASTLARGYAVVQAAGYVVRSVDDAPAGAPLRIRVSDGAVLAVSSGPEPDETSAPAEPPKNPSRSSKAATPGRRIRKAVP
jgi:exodeoxyribonuclease VII large subunit